MQERRRGELRGATLACCRYAIMRGESTCLWIVLVRKDCSPALDSVISITTLFPRDRAKLTLSPRRTSYPCVERASALTCAASILCNRASTNGLPHAEGRHVAQYLQSAARFLPAQQHGQTADTLAIYFYRCVGRRRLRRNASEWSGPLGRPSLIQESLYVR